jgi:hypothetical protein
MEIKIDDYVIRVEDSVYYAAVKDLIDAHKDEFVKIIKDIADIS